MKYVLLRSLNLYAGTNLLTTGSGQPNSNPDEVSFQEHALTDNDQ
jgi:hypothetical protein